MITSRSASNLWESPATIQVIDQQALQNSTSASIAGNLQDIPGIEIMDNSLTGHKQIRTRGEVFFRVLTLIDGQEVTYQRAGDNYGMELLIDESALERVEIVKGPYPALYGSQTIGGIINFIARKGGGELASGVVKAVYNSTTAGWEESIAIQGSIGGFDYRINDSHSDQGNRDTPGRRLPNTNYRNNGQDVWLDYNSGNHRFGSSLDRYRFATQTYYENPGGSCEAPGIKIPKLKREKAGISYGTDVDGDYLKKIHSDAYEQTIQRQFANEVKTAQPVPNPVIQVLTVHNKTDTHDKQYTQAVALQSHFSLPANNELVTGAQYKQGRVGQGSGSTTSSESLIGFIDKEIRTRSYYESEQSTISLFTQSDQQFANHQTRTMGVRQYWLSSELTRGDGVSYTASIIGDTSLARESASDHEVVTSTSLRCSGFGNLELRAAFAQNYVFPTLSQFFMRTSAGGNVTYGNPDLKAEYSNNSELSARYNNNRWLIDSAVYCSEAKDYIASLIYDGNIVYNGNTNSSRSSHYYYDNVDRAKTWGLRISTEYNGWAFSPYIGGSLIRRQYETSTLKTANAEEPAISGCIRLKHTLVMGQANIISDVFIRAVSSAKDDSNGTETNVPGWATLSFAVNTEFDNEDQYRINLALNNLTDKRYRTAHETIPAVGFSVAIGFVWNF